MRKLALALLAFSMLLVSGCTMWPEAKHATWKNATGLEQYERLFWDAVKAKDRANLEAHIASAYVFTGAKERRDKAGELAALDATQLTDYSLGDVQVSPGATGGVVTYTITLHGAPDASGTFHWMSVWERQKSGWVLVAQSATPVTQ